MGLESGNDSLRAKKGPNAMAAKVAAAVLALLSAAGCGQSAPSGWSAYKSAKDCASAPANFPDLAASCKDQAKFVEDVLANPNCKLPAGDTQLPFGTTTVTAREQATKGVADACGNKGQ